MAVPVDIGAIGIDGTESPCTLISDLLSTAIRPRVQEWIAGRLNTRGKGYGEDSGDGISYSYSVFDSLPLLARRMDRVVALPTRGDRVIGGFAFFQASHFLLCGFGKNSFGKNK